MARLPTLRLAVVQVAAPLVKAVAVQPVIATLSAVKLTVPVGVGVPPTVVVKVTLWPTVLGLRLLVNATAPPVNTATP